MITLTEKEVQDLLKMLLEEELSEGARVSSFEEAGILTRNAGLVVRLPDGSEFQITIVRSR